MPDRHKATAKSSGAQRDRAPSAPVRAAPAPTRPAGRKRRGSRSARKQVVDAGRGLPGHVHAAAGHHDRERGPAGYPAGTAFEFLGPAMGGRRVRADPGGVLADRGQPGRYVRPPAAVPGRPGRVHWRVGAVRVCRHHADAATVPRLAGRRRGDHVRGVAGAAGGRVPRPGPRGRFRGLGDSDRPGGRHRPAARRRADQRPFLAVHLLRERADRNRCGRHHDDEGGGIARVAGQPGPTGWAL